MAGIHTKNKRTKQWLSTHRKDYYVQQAQRDGYRSRAAYKLQALDTQAKLLRHGMYVLDLGAAPGGWSQYIAQHIGHGKVIACDLLAMEPIPKVSFVQGDFSDEALQQTLRQLLNGRGVDLVVSDAAPSMSGIASVDHPRVMQLLQQATDLAQHMLKPGGNLLLKAFQGEDLADYTQGLRRCFAKVGYHKPKASRPISGEVYVLARAYRGLEGNATDDSTN